MRGSKLIETEEVMVGLVARQELHMGCNVVLAAYVLQQIFS
jgi:hypothetical protein